VKALVFINAGGAVELRFRKLNRLVTKISVVISTSVMLWMLRDFLSAVIAVCSVSCRNI